MANKAERGPLNISALLQNFILVQLTKNSRDEQELIHQITNEMISKALSKALEALEQGKKVVAAIPLELLRTAMRVIWENSERCSNIAFNLN